MRKIVTNCHRTVFLKRNVLFWFQFQSRCVYIYRSVIISFHVLKSTRSWISREGGRFPHKAGHSYSRIRWSVASKGLKGPALKHNVTTSVRIWNINASEGICAALFESSKTPLVWLREEQHTDRHLRQTDFLSTFHRLTSLVKQHNLITFWRIGLAYCDYLFSYCSHNIDGLLFPK